MKKLFFYPVAAFVLTAGVCAHSCSKAIDDTGLEPETRAVPTVTDPVPVADMLRIGSVDLQDANPLNAGIYFINDSIPFYNVVMLNKVRITEGPGWKAFLGWDSGMQKVLDNPETYIRPLREKGIKVLLTITGYRVNGWGFANLLTDQMTVITDELAELVATCGFDGIEVEDEWTDYGANHCPMPNKTSYSNFLSMLRAKLPAGKLIYVKQVGHIQDLTAEALACVDRVWYGSSSFYASRSLIADLPAEKWVPLMYYVNTYYSERTMQVYVVRLINEGFRAIAFNRLDETPALKMFQKFAEVAFGEDTVVTQQGEIYPNKWR